MQVYVRDNDVNAAIRVLKKKMQREGTFREMKRRRSYEKPSERRVRERAEAGSADTQGDGKAARARGLLMRVRRKAAASRGLKKGARPLHKIAREGRVSTRCKSPGVC